jgi:hypothetical protein
MFEGRQTYAVAIQDMIRLIKRNGKRMLPKEDFDKLQEWAGREFKEDDINISLWRYINDDGETEVYIKTGHKACTALLYLVLNNQGEPAKIANPKELTKAQKVFAAGPHL